MHAVVHTVTLTDRSAAEAGLDEVVPRVTGLPGFVAGYWVARTADQGVAVVVFDSEEAAQGFANFLKSAPDAPGTTLNRDVGQVLASA
jgi:heme-degrading monooxygenase HmoA